MRRVPYLPSLFQLDSSLASAVSSSSRPSIAASASPDHILSVAARFPLCEAAAAQKEVERGGKVGTVIVEPQC